MDRASAVSRAAAEGPLTLALARALGMRPFARCLALAAEGRQQGWGSLLKGGQRRKDARTEAADPPSAPFHAPSLLRSPSPSLPLGRFGMGTAIRIRSRICTEDIA